MVRVPGAYLPFDDDQEPARDRRATRSVLVVPRHPIDTAEVSHSAPDRETRHDAGHTSADAYATEQDPSEHERRRPDIDRAASEAAARRIAGTATGPEPVIDETKLTGPQRTALRIYRERHDFLQTQADALGIDVATAASVLIVESGGIGHGEDGNLTIRFEPHIFKRLSGHDVADTHRGQSGEYHAFEAAKKIDRKHAFESISMGSGQVMGFNYSDQGYESAEDMFDAFQADELKQIEGMFTFIGGRSKLLAAAKRHDWLGFAKGYNGPKYKKNKYNTKLATHFAAYGHILKLMQPPAA